MLKPSRKIGWSSTLRIVIGTIGTFGGPITWASSLTGICRFIVLMRSKDHSSVGEFAYSLVIHCRMYAEQFRSSMPFDSHPLRNVTASRSTRISSFRSKAMGRTVVSVSIKFFNSIKFVEFICPLTVKRVSPVTVLRILSIWPRFRNLHPDAGQLRFHIKLL